jgi:hypothetical protein
MKQRPATADVGVFTRNLCRVLFLLRDLFADRDYEAFLLRD